MTSNSLFDEFRDIRGHWAEEVFVWAHLDGLIGGIEGNLHPDANVTMAQALTILCRILDAEMAADISDTGLPSGKWYYDYVAKAVHLGLIASVDEAALDSPLSRQDAFALLAEAFQLVEADPDMSVLDVFSDSKNISDKNRQAIASLVSQGIVAGYSGKLDVDGNLSRATFLTVIYRVVRDIRPSSNVNGDYERGVLIQGSASLSGISFGGGVWFDCGASDIGLTNVRAERAVVRSHRLDSFAIDGATHIGRLTIASQSGDIAVSPGGDAVVETVVIGSGDGAISVGGVGTVEITGNGRNVAITDNVDLVVVSGRDNTLHILVDAQVDKIELLTSARGSNVITEGNIDEMEIRSLSSAVIGGGYVGTMVLNRSDTKIDVKHGNIVDNVDLGLTGASIRLTIPESLPAGNTLNVRAAIDNAVPGVVFGLTWYIDDVAVLDASATVGEALAALAHKFEYSREMPDSARIKVVAKYVTALGEQQEIYAEGKVKLENYGAKHWAQLDTPRVLEKVTLGYKGDFTLEWALANDLEDYEKEVWVNAKGYTSTSEYLLWINLAYQRVNIFIRSEDAWELIRTCVVGTGAPGSGTPPGVWTTSFKQEHGWTTGTYTVKPVVRFRDSSGYAFHSRLYLPGTTTLQDPSIGFPISRGCIRMYDEDIQFIFDYIPNGTTVVVH